MTQEKITCPHCGANMKEWKHSLTRGLVDILMKFGNTVSRSGKNDVHIKEMGFTVNQFNNFQKLRYFGLVAKVRNDEDMHIQGHWLITRRGWLFLKGDIAVHKSIKTFRNSITERSEEKVKIYEVLKDYSEEYYQNNFNL